MNDDCCASGSGESFKAGIHLAVFGLAAMCAGYNALAFSLRRERHLLVNAIVYGGLVAYEAAQIHSHRQELGP